MMVVILALSSFPSDGKTYLVSVGIADYPGNKHDLRVSAEDAVTINKVFLATKHATSKVLLNHEVTKEALLNNMDIMFANADSDDTIILYFSGHGVEGSFVCYDGFLSYQRILDKMKNYRANKKIIMADACFSGKIRKGNQKSTTYSNQDVMFFLSSRSKEMSKETKFKNSLFTIFLERGLRGGADTNKDRKITARELYDFVHDGVVDASGNRQHPVMWGKFDNNMTIIQW